MSWWEIGMLICFGSCWFFSIHKMLKTRKAEGKSNFFLVLMILGCVFGVLHKLYTDLDLVVLLYGFFAVMAFVDLSISRRLQRYDREATLAAQNQARRASLTGGGSTDGRHHGRRHSHGRRRHGSHKYGSSSSIDEGTFEATAAKEPKYGDDLEFDDLNEAS